MAAGVLLVLLLVLAATFDAVVADAHAPGDLTTTTTAAPTSSDPDPSTAPTSAAASLLQGPAPEAQALGGTPRLQDDSVDEQEEDDEDEEYEESDDDEYYDEGDEDAYEDPSEFEYEDAGEGDEEDDGGRDDDEEYEDEDYGEDDGEEAAADGSDGSVTERKAGAAAAAAAKSKEEDAEEEKVIQDAVVRERRAEVRSLSDLPLAKLLRVQSELRRLTGHSKGKDQCDSHKKKSVGEGATRRWLTGAAAADKGASAPTTPNAQPLNWGAAATSRRGITTSTSTQPSVRRRGGSGGDRGGDRGGGWSSHEEWEEDVHEVEEDDGGGWISWDKGHKKKGKGDIGSIFHISVTFLAFLAFGGYLLCLIMQAIKGNGYYGYGYGYGSAAAQGALRPAQNVMMVMMPTRAVTRRPTRPATGRRRRDAGGGGGGESSWRDWVPTLGEEELRLLPEMDVDRMHRALLVLAEGYASFYHKRYTSPVQQAGRDPRALRAAGVTTASPSAAECDRTARSGAVSRSAASSRMLGRTLAVSAALWLLAAPAPADLERAPAPASQQHRHISLPGVLDPAGVVGQIGETLGQAGRVLGLRIADTVADLVSSAFGHGHAKQQQQQQHAAYPQPSWTRGDPGVVPPPGPYYQHNLPPQPTSAVAPTTVLGGILKLLGLDSSKLGAIALNGVIFLAQLISSSLGSRPSLATRARHGGDAPNASADDAQGEAAAEDVSAEEEDLEEEEPAGTPLSWILDNPAVKGSSVLREARDADLSERLIAEIQKRFPSPRRGAGAGAGGRRGRARRAGAGAAEAGAGARADTSCIQLLVCKAGPFLRGMQRSLRPALGAHDSAPRPAAPGAPGAAGAPKGDPGVPTDKGQPGPGQQSAEEVAEAERWRRLSPVQRMFAHMPSAGEVLDQADTCAERFPDCKVSY
ncbi:Midasin [Frankliniella fusca]|uniref:Midasin n=1 Tax=Frankliniella fusca TaxID=407009 RepID=A0AAE1LJR2_9NEOP|nr:Midasin [Frankliniella fusca]